MSQYNKTVLTNAGLELAKRANAGQAKFEITRAVTSADDWSNKTIQDLEAVTAIPNIMQQGTVMDTEEVESNNSVIGVSLCFANKDLSTGYQIKIIGLYVKEEGQDKDFLYAVTTAVTPEYMPDFNDKVLYRFNMQMYLVIGKAQAVNVVINDGASVTHGQFDKYKSEVTANLEKIENAHKEDMSHVVKSASINGGDEILPDEAGKLELVVPAPDLSKYVSLEQLTEALKTKADITAIPDKTATEEGIKQAKELAQEADAKAQNALDNKADKTTVEGDLATKANASDLSALQNSAMQVIAGNSGDDILSFRDEKIRRYNNAQNVKNLPGMSNINWFYVITHTKDDWGNVTVISQDNCYWQNVLNGSNWSGWVKHATSVDITDLQNQINANNQGTFTTGYDWNTGTPTNQSRTLQNAWIVDQSILKGAVDRMNSINSNANGRLSLGGGNMNLRSTINWNGGEINDKTGNLGGLNWAGGTDWAKIYGDQDDNDNLDLAIDLGDDGANHVSFRKNGSETSAITSDGHFTGTVDWSNVSGRPDVATHADVNNAIDSIRYAPQERRSLGADDDANNIVDDGVYRISGNPIKNGNDQTWCFLRVKRWDYNTIYQELDCGTTGIFIRNISQTNRNYPGWQKIATSDDISNLQNQIQQLRDNQFEVQTFTDATAAANWEAQKPGKRMAIVNS